MKDQPEYDNETMTVARSLPSAANSSSQGKGKSRDRQSEAGFTIVELGLTTVLVATLLVSVLSIAGGHASQRQTCEE